MCFTESEGPKLKAGKATRTSWADVCRRIWHYTETFVEVQGSNANWGWTRSGFSLSDHKIEHSFTKIKKRQAYKNVPVLSKYSASSKTLSGLLLPGVVAAAGVWTCKPECCPKQQRVNQTILSVFLTDGLTPLITALSFLFLRVCECYLQVTPGSKAAQGDLCPGDTILAINGDSTELMTHMEAQNKIKTCTQQLALSISR